MTDLVNIGSAPNAGDGDPLRTAFANINAFAASMLALLPWPVSIVAKEALSARDPVHLTVTGSPAQIVMEKADATDTTKPADGYVVADVAMDAQGGFYPLGVPIVSADSPAPFVEGARYYVAVGGGLTTTAPSGAGQRVQMIGVALSDSTLETVPPDAFGDALPVSQGGTGATSASAARAALDVYSTSEVDSAVGAATPTTLDDLTDVNTAGASNGDVLTYDATSPAGWVPSAPSGGSAKPFITFRPIDNEPPTSNFASLDTRNGHPVLNFDTTTQETAIFSGVMPTGYAGGNLIVSVFTAAASATTGTIGWLVAIERIDASSLDIDADSFAADQTITAATVPGTSGQILKLQVTITAGSATDNLAAGEAFRLRIKRDVSNDTATGDAQLLRATIEEA